MSRPGTVVYTLTDRVSLVVTAADVDAALTHAQHVARGYGCWSPVAVSAVITEDITTTSSEVWSDTSHEDAVSWVKREAHRAPTLVGTVIRS